MIIIIDIGTCVELNTVSPKMQSLINIFLYFCFSLFSTNSNLPGLLKVKSCKFCGNAFFYSATCFNWRAAFLSCPDYFLGCGDMNLQFTHFYLNFKCPISFAFPSVSSRELLFLTWRSGGSEWAIDVLMKMTGMRVIGLKMKTDTLIVLCGILMTCG